MRRLFFTIAFSIAAAASLLAAGFWETKPFTMWSDKELAEILNDSPWSRRVQVVLNTVGGGSGDIDARGGGGDDGGGRGGRGGFPVSAPQLKLVISWRSSLPMKQAFTRAETGLGGAVSEETQRLLDREETQYVVEILGFPTRYENSIGTMKEVTFLKRGGKPPIGVAEAAAQKTAAGIAIMFAFPKSDAVTLDDKDVEFVTKLGTFDIKKKFSLKDMVFRGKLEL